MDRLKFLEDHIVQLEKEYPPWAALHFNQPRRGVCSLTCHFDPRPNILTLLCYSGRLRRDQHLSLSLLTSLLPHPKAHIQGHRTATPRRLPQKPRRRQCPSLEVNCPTPPLRRARESLAGLNPASIARLWRSWKYRERCTISPGPETEVAMYVSLRHCVSSSRDEGKRDVIALWHYGSGCIR